MINTEEKSSVFLVRGVMNEYSKISSLKGIGEKTALKLIKEFENIGFAVEKFSGR